MADEPDPREAAQRALMDRFRAQAERPPEAQPRRVLQHAVALALAIALVSVVLVGFDKFLTSMQKFMEVEIHERVPASPASAPAAEPMPAFVVEPEVSPQSPAGPDPRPSPQPAPDNVPATR